MTSGSVDRVLQIRTRQPNMSLRPIYKMRKCWCSAYFSTMFILNVKTKQRIGKCLIDLDIGNLIWLNRNPKYIDSRYNAPTVLRIQPLDDSLPLPHNFCYGVGRHSFPHYSPRIYTAPFSGSCKAIFFFLTDGQVSKRTDVIMATVVISWFFKK